MFFDDVYKKYKPPIPQAIFNIQNVCDYVYSMPQEYFELTDCISFMPPFRNTWFEFNRPKQSNFEGKIIKYEPEYWGRIGYSMINATEEIKKISSDLSFLFMLKQEDKLKLISIINDEDTHIFTWSTFIEVGHDIIYLGNILLICDKNGRFITFYTSDKKPVIPVRFSDYIIEKIGDSITPATALSTITGGCFAVFIMAFNFLHCKNVEAVINKIPPKLVKSRQKKNKPFFERTYTLQIKQIKKYLSEANDKGTGIKKALHICRGHFKTFTESKPLFGRHVGTYWWNDQVKGNQEIGRIIKDYKI